MTTNINQAVLKLVEISGRGRSVVAAAPLIGGQVILRESAILLYSALPILPPPSSSGSNPRRTYCAHCFKLVSSTQSTTIPCSSCSVSHFCSSDCFDLAVTSSHTPLVCQSLRKLLDSATSLPLLQQNVELQVQARFLIAAYNLSQVSPPHFRTLASLQGGPSDFLDSPESTNTVNFLHNLVSSFLPTGSEFSVELIATLLAKDKINAFGIMESSEPGHERSVRAYGIYPHASLFNHDCLPNACRFDYFDGGKGKGSNTDIMIRMIHDVPEGREICLSYFPVNLKYSERQRRLTEDYGFVCDCDRCKVEANWSDQEEEGEGEDEEGSDVDEGNGLGETAMDDDEDEGMGEVVDDEGSSAQQDSDFPHAYFFLKYMCAKENCWGTMAPIPPVGSESTNVKECNVCGYLNDS